MQEKNPIQSFSILSAKYSMYTADEIKKLSVKEIYNPVSLDLLYNANRGGLYDPELGTQSKFQLCEKCGLPYSTMANKSMEVCPGHLGHISFPLPLFNPLTFHHMFMLLRAICFKCGLFLKKQYECVLFVMEMRALEQGIVTAPEDMRVILRSCLVDVKETNSDSIIQDFSAQLDDYISTCTSSYEPDHPVKNTEGLKKACVKTFFEKLPKVCTNCKCPTRNLRHENMAQIFFTSRKEDKKFDEVRGMESGERILLQNIVSQLDARLLLAKVCTNQPHVMAILCNSPLSSASSSAAAATALLSSPSLASPSAPIDVYFLDNLLVAPTRTRPMSRFKATLVDKPLSVNLKHILTASLNLKALIASEEKDNHEGKMRAWLDVQMRVNAHFDQNLSKMIKDSLPGIKQLLEKKEGLLRMNMMGKRVNSAARSVISPDPYLACNEVGLPEEFAKRLFVSEPVLPRNFEALRQAVSNGPDKYPGAHSIEMENRRVVLLQGLSAKERKALARQLLTPSVQQHPCKQPFKTVRRHMRSGDMMLLNRQPTLHKPSMQTFKARVLPMEKTLRINYTSCKAFNADFDGDEMNAHLIEALPAKAEATSLAIADEQYLVPKDGKPIAGLIQDHMVSGVLLTVKGTHFCKREYEELVFACLPSLPHCIKLLPPCILKPCALWSGKQVISTVLLNLIPEGSKPLNLRGKSKISDKEWKRPWLAVSGGDYSDLTESEVVVSGGELLTGVLDKNHYGATAYGLVHCCYEMYGGRVSSELLSTLARLFTYYLRSHHSFTLGIEDIIISKEGDQARKKEIGVVGGCGISVVSKALREPAATEEEGEEGLKRVQFSKKKIELLELDGAINSQMTQFQDAIKTSCWPKNLIKAFPANNLQLMVQSGAKGSLVNCMQISCLLGQVDLEGCRPPRCISGASLPSFKPYDLAPRAGGFISDRFLTGLACQEFFFHCMAGRDGLVDTAVKTSRSGYLQRCLIKHLEALMVVADGTVRDADGSIIQFKYGEDSLDIMKTAYLQQNCFDHLLDNRHILLDNHVARQMSSLIQLGKVDKLQEYVKCHDRLKAPKLFTIFSRKELPKVRAAHPGKKDEWCMERVEERFQALNDKQLSKLSRKHLPRTKHPLKGVMHAASQAFLRQVELFIEGKNASKRQDRTDMTSKSLEGLSDDDVRMLFYSRFLQAQVTAGEAVGILAATSIGEQTTQMTLNTFHFAGHGAMNVTLGIPRLREILMVASRDIKTPMMEVPLLKSSAKLEKKVERLSRKLHRIPLERIISKVFVRELICKDGSRQYHLRVEVADDSEFKISKQAVLKYLERSFIAQVVKAIAKHQIELSASGLLVAKKFSTKKMMDEVGGGGGGGEGKSDVVAGEDDKSDSEDEDNDNEVVLSRKKDKVYADEGDDDDEVDSDGEEVAEGAEKMDDETEIKKEKNAAAADSSAEDGPTDESPPSKKMKMEDGISKKDSVEKSSKGVLEECPEYFRRLEAVKSMKHVVDYSFDAEEHNWIEVVLMFANFSKEMDVQSVVDTELRKTVINQVPGISKGMIKVIDNKNSPAFMFASARKQADECGTPLRKKLQIEGLNIQEVYKYQDKLCVDQLYTNDIHTIATTYGIEAAVQNIIEEIRSVFKAYGIDVDYRHLSLIADYMTFEGQFKAFNRFGLDNNASPLQKMSFESALQALKKIIHEGGVETFDSPSACLMIGKPIKTGTGFSDILVPVS